MPHVQQAGSAPPTTTSSRYGRVPFSATQKETAVTKQHTDHLIVRRGLDAVHSCFLSHGKKVELNSAQTVRILCSISVFEGLTLALRTLLDGKLLIATS